MKQQLLYWMRKDEIDDKMLWKKAASHQEIFVRDQIGSLIQMPVFVISLHRSKSITLPVYGFTMRNGIKVIARENFYGWKLSVTLPRERPYAEIIPEDIISEGYKGKRIPSCYFEGFKEEWCHCSYRPDVKQRKFSIGIYSDYKFYTAMYILSHLYEDIDFTKEAENLTKDNVAKAIRKVYAEQGNSEMEKNSWGGYSPVMSGFEILWQTYKLFDDYRFREKNHIEGFAMDDSDNPDKYAEHIVKYPELRKVFCQEMFGYNQKY